MSTGLNVNNSTIVSAFYNELLRQGLVVAVIVMLIGVAWSISRSAQLRRAASGQQESGRTPRPSFFTARGAGAEAVDGSPSASSGSSTASSRARRLCLSAWPLR